jgi:Na+-driven multidrug efflux pump
MLSNPANPTTPSLKIGAIALNNAWKELLLLFFPILIILLGGSAVGSFERVCLARYSLDALNSSVEAVCALRFFQLSCIAFANMAQIFIGEYIGSKKPEKAGVCAWQMIWLSVLSMLLILPIVRLWDLHFSKERSIALPHPNITIY